MKPVIQRIGATATAALLTAMPVWAVDVVFKHADVWIPQLVNQTYLEVERELCYTFDSNLIIFHEG